MRCPVCETEGQPSELHVSVGAITTLLAINQYYDNEGRYHLHNRNTSTGSWHCSRGHSGAVHYSNRCPSCEFGQGTQLAVIERPATC